MAFLGDALCGYAEQSNHGSGTADFLLPWPHSATTACFAPCGLASPGLPWHRAASPGSPLCIASVRWSAFDGCKVHLWLSSPLRSEWIWVPVPFGVPLSLPCCNDGCLQIYRRQRLSHDQNVPSILNWLFGFIFPTVVLTMLSASVGVTSTHAPWNHSSQPSHWIINRPCHGFLQKQYTLDSSAVTVWVLSGFSNHLIIHSGNFLSLQSFIRSWFTTNMDLRNCTRNSDAESFSTVTAGPFQGLHSFLHLPFKTAVSRR